MNDIPVTHLFQWLRVAPTSPDSKLVIESVRLLIDQGQGTPPKSLLAWTEMVPAPLSKTGWRAVPRVVEVEMKET